VLVTRQQESGSSRLATQEVLLTPTSAV